MYMKCFVSLASTILIISLNLYVHNLSTGLNYERYKFVVQVIIGERRDQGVRYFIEHCRYVCLGVWFMVNVHGLLSCCCRMGTRCFWDSTTDNQASATFFNVSTQHIKLFLRVRYIFLVFAILVCGDWRLFVCVAVNVAGSYILRGNGVCGLFLLMFRGACTGGVADY